MAHAYSIQSSSISSPLFQYSSSISSLSSRTQMLVVFIGSSILMFIVILTMILCFVDCLRKKPKQNSTHISMVKTNGINHHPLTNGNHSPSNNSKSFKSLTNTKPVIVIATSNSHSSSSIDSTTRANTAHNRAITNTYTYTALSTSDDLMPVDFDDDSAMDNNGVEYMMTTV
jgi:hypothetical protein